MLYKISNNVLEVEINSLGAELQSIKFNGTEYLWQGNKTYWGGRAYNLFPICGRLTDNRYEYDGKSYEMILHGFLRKSELTATRISDNEIDFCLKANNETLAAYPFDFEYRINYALIGRKINMTINVSNRGENEMYFAIGGHPGFNVPFSDDKFEDYYLELSDNSRPKGILLSDNCFITTESYDIPVIDGKILPLRHEMFDKDALIIEGLKSPIRLKSKNHGHYVKIEFPEDMKYVGLWHTPKTKAPFVCIEPWTGVPSYDNKLDDIETKRDMFKLPKNSKLNLTWSISIK